MRLIDADALAYERITRSGDDEVVEVIPKDDIDAVPTICCERCEHWMIWDKHRERYDCEIEASGEGFIEPYFGCVHFKEAGR